MKESYFKFAGLLFAGLFALFNAQAQDIPAFPGAEGFGRYSTTGGRGGEVYHVTKLTDGTEEGTFRWACNKAGARTIVFDVSGTINLTSELKLRNGNVTIAGQTAPGDGICVAGYPFVISSSNVIIRFIRFRLGNVNVAKHEGDGLGGMDARNIIIDHCSVSWSIDECLSVYGSRDFSVQWCLSSQSLKNAGHSKGSHGYGGNWGGSGASYHHNLMAHHESRVPRLGPRPGTQKDERMDMRNNVFYNWAGNGCYGGEGMNVNIVNNYYKVGPATEKRSTGIQKRIAALGIRTVDYCLDNKAAIATAYNKIKGTSLTKNNISGTYLSSTGKCYITIQGKKYEIDMTSSPNKINVDGTDIAVKWNDWKAMMHVWGKLYVSGNYNSKFPDMNQFKEGVTDQVDRAKNDGTFPGEEGIKLAEPLEYGTITTHSAETAYEKVLAYAGASLHRDRIDEQMVNDTRNGIATATGSGNYPGIINSQDDNKPEGATDWSAWPELASYGAKVDTDGDGIPDDWEMANGLRPDYAEDAKEKTIDQRGWYTNLEVYINSLVEDMVKAQNAEADTPVDEYYPSYVPTGIDNVFADMEISESKDIYSVDGRVVKRKATVEDLKSLQKGLYIYNGKKFVVK